MRGRSYTTQAVVISTKNYSEADRILTVFTKDFGKLTLMAKGVRRPKSKKGRNVEVFSLLKLSAAKGKGMDVLTEVETLENFSNIRSDLTKTAVAYFMVDTIRSITREDEEIPSLFVTLAKYLKKLDAGTTLKTFRKSFTTDVLKISGYWPKDKPLKDPDGALTEVLERELKTISIGRKLQS